MTVKSFPIANKAIYRIFTFFVIFYLFCLSIPVKAQENLSLKKAIQLALQNNVQIKVAALNESLDEVDLTQARNNTLPNLYANNQTFGYYGRSIDPSTNLFVNANILGVNQALASQIVLYQGGLLRKQILEGKLLLEADKSNVAKIKNEVILSVVTTYLQVMANKDLLKAAKQQVSSITQSLERLQKNIEIGYNKALDLTPLKAQFAAAELNQIKAQNQLDMSVLTIKQLMEMDSQKTVTFEMPDSSGMKGIKILYDPLDVYKNALEVNPDVRLAVSRQQLAYQNITIAKSSYYPSIMLFAGLNSNYSSVFQQVVGQSTSTLPIGYLSGNPGQLVLAPYTQPIYGKYPFLSQLKDNLNEAIGFNIHIPIFSRFANNSAIKKSRINYQIAGYNAQLAKDNLNKIVTQAILDLQAADKKYAGSKLTYQASKNTYDIAQERFRLGSINPLEYNTAFINLNKSEFEMIEARYELIFKSKLIDYYLGNPLDF